MTTLSPIEVYFSSAYADFYINGEQDRSDVLFYFSDPIKRPLGCSMRIKVSSIVIPLSFTLINEDNDTLVVNGTPYTLTHGNYNAVNLKTHLNSVLSGLGITAAFDSITEKYTFTRGAPFTFNSTSTCFLLLGFTNVDHSSVGNSLTSDSVVNLSGAVNELYIDIPSISTLNLNSKTGQRTSIIKSIPVAASPGTVLFWENRTDSSVLIQDDVISFFHIRLLGEDLSTPVRFNSQDWNLTLEIGFTPQANQTELTMKDFNGVLNYRAELLKVGPQGGALALPTSKPA